ncbi:hypothetical protein ADUPG1_012865 [Aduncisulcus paluster]|uniref:Uncharacterized protein n=1 Tax=Aduncisulcus paluster TaxID=2918883 RepID=A0ABQ5K0X5_9EUKA|nr:hypothetical protein ADUPG1_012865 [Aduncisulcus paluster]
MGKKTVHQHLILKNVPVHPPTLSDSDVLRKKRISQRKSTVLPFNSVKKSYSTAYKKEKEVEESLHIVKEPLYSTIACIVPSRSEKPHRKQLTPSNSAAPVLPPTYSQTSPRTRFIDLTTDTLHSVARNEEERRFKKIISKKQDILEEVDLDMRYEAELKAKEETMRRLRELEGEKERRAKDIEKKLKEYVLSREPATESSSNHVQSIDPLASIFLTSQFNTRPSSSSSSSSSSNPLNASTDVGVTKSSLSIHEHGSSSSIQLPPESLMSSSLPLSHLSIDPPTLTLISALRAALHSSFISPAARAKVCECLAIIISDEEEKEKERDDLFHKSIRHELQKDQQQDLGSSSGSRSHLPQLLVPSASDSSIGPSHGITLSDKPKPHKLGPSDSQSKQYKASESTGSIPPISSSSTSSSSTSSSSSIGVIRHELQKDQQQDLGSSSGSRSHLPQLLVPSASDSSIGPSHGITLSDKPKPHKLGPSDSQSKQYKASESTDLGSSSGSRSHLPQLLVPSASDSSIGPSHGITLSDKPKPHKLGPSDSQSKQYKASESTGSIPPISSSSTSSSSTSSSNPLNASTDVGVTKSSLSIHEHGSSSSIQLPPESLMSSSLPLSHLSIDPPTLTLISALRAALHSSFISPAARAKVCECLAIIISDEEEKEKERDDLFHKSIRHELQKDQQQDLGSSSGSRSHLPQLLVPSASDSSIGPSHGITLSDKPKPHKLGPSDSQSKQYKASESTGSIPPISSSSTSSSSSSSSNPLNASTDVGVTKSSLSIHEHGSSSSIQLPPESLMSSSLPLSHLSIDPPTLTLISALRAALHSSFISPAARAKVCECLAIIISDEEEKEKERDDLFHKSIRHELQKDQQQDLGSSSGSRSHLPQLLVPSASDSSIGPSHGITLSDKPKPHKLGPSDSQSKQYKASESTGSIPPISSSSTSSSSTSSSSSIVASPFLLTPSSSSSSLVASSSGTGVFTGLHKQDIHFLSQRIHQEERVLNLEQRLFDDDENGGKESHGKTSTSPKKKKSKKYKKNGGSKSPSQSQQQASKLSRDTSVQIEEWEKESRMELIQQKRRRRASLSSKGSPLATSSFNWMKETKSAARRRIITRQQKDHDKLVAEETAKMYSSSEFVKQLEKQDREEHEVRLLMEEQGVFASNPHENLRDVNDLAYSPATGTGEPDDYTTSFTDHETRIHTDEVVSHHSHSQNHHNHHNSNTKSSHVHNKSGKHPSPSPLAASVVVTPSKHPLHNPPHGEDITVSHEPLSASAPGTRRRSPQVSLGQGIDSALAKHKSLEQKQIIIPGRHSQPKKDEGVIDSSLPVASNKIGDPPHVYTAQKSPLYDVYDSTYPTDQHHNPHAFAASVDSYHIEQFSTPQEAIVMTKQAKLQHKPPSWQNQDVNKDDQDSFLSPVSQLPSAPNYPLEDRTEAKTMMNREQHSHIDPLEETDSVKSRQHELWMNVTADSVGKAKELEELRVKQQKELESRLDKERRHRELAKSQQAEKVELRFQHPLSSHSHYSSSSPVIHTYTPDSSLTSHFSGASASYSISNNSGTAPKVPQLMTGQPTTQPSSSPSSSSPSSSNPPLPHSSDSYPNPHPLKEPHHLGMPYQQYLVSMQSDATQTSPILSNPQLDSSLIRGKDYAMARTKVKGGLSSPRDSSASPNHNMYGSSPAFSPMDKEAKQLLFEIHSLKAIAPPSHRMDDAIDEGGMDENSAADFFKKLCEE